MPFLLPSLPSGLQALPMPAPHSPRLATLLRDPPSGMRLSPAGQGAARARRRGSSSPTPFAPPPAPGVTAPFSSSILFPSPGPKCQGKIPGGTDGPSPSLPPQIYTGDSSKSETRWGWGARGAPASAALPLLRCHSELWVTWRCSLRGHSSRALPLFC